MATDRMGEIQMKGDPGETPDEVLMARSMQN